ncbi:hypothetical protein AVEN_82272-1 [Araneus ventricosus]|uniref:Uncharacterized protein n=1 Tax=Araneus ventricosus TaxID=182803 RepID=A0A4Y2HDP3_ARAVE|nr:hypothetical protein AVEN_82272-1 [Araneus ventricosus]
MKDEQNQTHQVKNNKTMIKTEKNDEKHPHHSPKNQSIYRMPKLKLLAPLFNFRTTAAKVINMVSRYSEKAMRYDMSPVSAMVLYNFGTDIFSPILYRIRDRNTNSGVCRQVAL